MLEDEEDDKNRILEANLAEWYINVQVHLKDGKRLPGRCNYNTIHVLDEIDYWEERLLDLELLNAFVQSKRVIKTVDHLRKFESAYVRLFENMTISLMIEIVKARSNLNFLQILRKPCTDLYAIKSLNDVRDKLPDLFFKFIFIMEESTYYNKPSNFNDLCNYLINQIIYLCRNTIDVTIVLDYDYKDIAQLIHKSLQCCECFISEFQEIVKQYNFQENEHLWVKARDMYTFLARLKDLKYLMKAKAVFKRLNVNHMDVLEPVFSFVPGIKFAETVALHERRFDTILNELKEPLLTIFDVTNEDWSYHMKMFQGKLNQLCVDTEQLAEDLLNTACNVLERVNILQCLRYFYEWPPLESFFQEKAQDVFKYLIDGIKRMEKWFSKQTYKICPYMPMYAGVSVLAFTQFKRISYLGSKVTERPWLKGTKSVDRFRHSYFSFIKLNRHIIQDLLKTWWDRIDPNIEEQLKKNILVESQTIDHRWTFNMDLNSDVYELLDEFDYWKLSKVKMPYGHKEFIKNVLYMKSLYKNASVLVKNYNEILASLSKSEMKLFSLTLKSCAKTFKPLFKKFTWSQANAVNTCLAEFFEELETVQETVDVYKNCNFEILNLCTTIANSPLYHEELAQEMIDITTSIEDYSVQKKVKEIVRHYNEIIKYVTIVYEGFGSHIKQMTLYWNRYLEKIDFLVHEALILNVRWSIEIICTHRNEPICLISVALSNNKIKYIPNLIQLVMYSMSSLINLSIALKVIPRLCEIFKMTNINLMPYSHNVYHDPVCSEVQDKINQMTNSLLKQIKNYMGQIMAYSEIWTVNKQEYFRKFKSSDHTSKDFDEKITMYINYLNSIKEVDNETVVSWVIINIVDIKAQIIQHCKDWIFHFSQLLLDETNDLIEGFYEYMEYNSIRVMTPPSNLNEMVEFIEIQKKLALESKEKKEEMNAIADNIFVLEKHKIKMSLAMYNLYNKLFDSWNAYTNVLYQAELMLKEKQDVFQEMVLNQQEQINKEIIEFGQLWKRFKETASVDEELTATDALHQLNILERKYEQLIERRKQVESNLAIFNIKYIKPPVSVKRDMQFMHNVFKFIYDWDNAWNSYKTGNFWHIKQSDMEITVLKIFKGLTVAIKKLKDEHWKLIDFARDKVDAFKRVLPLINDLKNPAMRTRHWDEVRHVMNKIFDESDVSFTLELIMQMQMQKYAEQISEVSNKATMELNIENSLKAIKEVWENMTLTVEPYDDEGTYRIKASDEILQLLEEHLVQLYSMKGSKYIPIFLKEADYWEKGLALVLEVLEMALSVQRQIVYSENIFKGDDVRSTIPKETEAYEMLTKEWKRITRKMYKNQNVFSACHSKPLLKKLNAMNDKLSDIQRALEVYMEKKRNIFPRFYFISNDDLLDILVNANNPERLQPHFKKCFDNINKIKFENSTMTQEVTKEGLGMYSADGEYVPWFGQVTCTGPVEYWFKQIEAEMRDSLRYEFKDVISSLKKNLKTPDEWILKWTGQLCVTASQVQWTTNCTIALTHCKIMENRKPLRKLRKKQRQMLSKFSDAIRGDLRKIDRLKIVALVTIEIHARDVIDKMYRTNCIDESDFQWISQLRFYYDKDFDDIIIRQTNTEQYYGFEYLGNSGRLVITPLTDRCYITLTTAISLFRGGSPKGPAGTGKTETVKDLGKNLAYYVIVINCSEGLDYKSMGRMFSGLSQQGAWGCFDEFNRINIEVLSVVAQQILSIYTALAARAKNFMFEGNNINLISTCGIFITMNPGYAGRTELPDNLKSMFRSISMMVPDSKLIAEITLFGEGFRDTLNLANKVYVLFLLCRQQLSKQDHYEFGLRGLVALLRYAGQCRRQYSYMPDDEILLLAMHNMNLAKLTVDDLPLFLGITNDLFPGIVLPAVKNDVLVNAIQRCMKKKNHQPSESAIAKIIQLYETKISRHSVMVLGKTGAAKTSTWKTLKEAMITLNGENVASFEKVIEYPLNPKALTLGELYGEYNLSTQEWMDGVISSIMRKVCAETGPEQKWILFDGPVDAVWIENMNSVMDDNKVLTLINSERITMPEQVTLLFEVQDLAVASPATVSRCGIVYNDYKDFGWALYVESWLNNCRFKTYRDHVEHNFKKYINDVLEFKQYNCVETVPLPELSSIVSLCKLMEHFTFKNLANDIPPGLSPEDYEYLINIWFLFCMIWSVCAVVNEDGRKKMDSFLRESEKVFPVSDTVYHYYVDTNLGQFRHWDNFLREDQWIYDPEIPFFKIIVPTIDTVRYNYLVEAFMSEKQPVLLVGPVGTGKTSTVQKAIDNLDKNKFLLLTINMSAQTTAHNVQETIEGRLEKRTKDLYAPQANKTLVTFLDDLNMPEKEVYGAQPPLELIRQWIDYEFWFDRHNQQLKYVKNMLLIGAMGPPGGGRNTISKRLMSCFSMINLTFPEEPQISKIYTSMLYEHLKPFEEHIRNLGNGLTEMTIALYKNVVATMLPTPAKIHYLFNLRDISKVFQGLLRSNIVHQKTIDSMLRLWCNEVFRVFNDKLIDKNDREWFLDQINLQLGKQYEKTYRSLCSSERSPLFCDFLNKQSMYEEVADEKYLRQFVENKLDEYNSNPGVVPMNLVLFRDAIDHVCRIVRVISQPRGYILLIGIGGTGRSSLAKISNWLCNYNMFTIELTKTYSTADFKEDLKYLYYQTGVKDQPTSFLFNDTQIVSETFLEIVNNMLSTGEVTKLYKADEFDEIKESLSNAAKLAGVPETTDAMYSFFLDRVRSNMHIILCFSPIGNKFRVRLRQNPSLVNCTTIDWFLDWPKEALLEVAFRSLSTLEVLETITGETRMFDVDTVNLTENELKLNIANLFAIIHDSVVEYSNRMILELKRYNYVTPTNYLELVSGYKDTLYLKRIEVSNAANKLRNGLFKINDTSEKVAGMTVELEKATETVIKYTEECDKFAYTILDQTAIADKQKIEVDEKSIKIKEEEIICQEMYRLAKADLEMAMPALEEAMEALNALNKNDLAEVKSFSKPPERVKLVLEAVMILKQSEPSWAEAKRQLGDPNFLIQLKDFDKDHIPSKVLKKINIYTRNPEFEPEKVGIQSIAAKSLAKWVIAIEKYAKIYKIVAPKKESAEAALLSLKEKQLSLAAAQEKLTQIQNLLLKLKDDYQKNMEEKERLVKKAEELRRNLERAASLIDGLSGERERWTQSVKQLDIDFDYLPGDCLLSIAFVSYMGPFVFKYRDLLIKLWTKSVRDMEIPCNPEYEIKEFLSDPAVIRNWNIHGLPNDDFSTENGIIINRCSRWPLIIDPQCQALKWLKNMEAQNNLKVIDFCLPGYMYILEAALKEGCPILLQITSENLDPAIMPILSKSIVISGDQLYIKMGDKTLPYNENFRFFITTKIRNPYFPPEIFTRTTVVNFALKEEGLEDQLLDVVIRMELPELKELKDNLVINIDRGKKTLVELEDELLRLLNEIEGSLLENEELFQTLASSKVTSATVNEQLESSLTTQAEINIAREGYRICAKQASILFFVLNELNLIDPMYQFALDSYMALFENSITKSVKDTDLQQRLYNLNRYHTYAVYQNTCRGLFETHKLLFSFQICISLLMAEGLIKSNEIEFLLKGGIVVNKEKQTENPCTSWLPNSSWDNITELDKLPGFLGIEKSFEQFAREWKEWYMAPNPEDLGLVGKWNDNSNILKKLLFVRCLRLDRLSFAIANFISDRPELGSKFIEPPVMDVKSALDDSSNKTPLIFLLSAGVDPTNMLTILASNQSKNLYSLSLGQGQAPYATQMIEAGKTEGHWVFLANCHLSLSWMPQLDKIVDVMQDGKSHPEFRLWLSSNPHPDFPISILQSAIKMTTEPPKGLKANMKRLYQSITENRFNKCNAHEKYTKLLFSLCFFHSILIERKKFQYLGWNVIYSFNDSDFEVSEKLLSIYLDKYDETPWNALKYLIAGICYGGHVTDDWDRRLLDTYINQYFVEKAITEPYHRLSSSLSYYIPRESELYRFRDYIESLPLVDSPEAFGQNSNAEMASLMGMNRTFCDTLIVLQGQSSTVAEENKEENVLHLSSKILQKLPDLIDYTTTVKNIGIKKNPLDVVLLQEIQRYNTLLEVIKLSLIGLEKGIKGLVVMSSDLEEVFQCMFEGRVPSQWLKAYPSLMSLGAWTQDLLEKFNYFTIWANKIHPPVLFWLGAFTYPTSFLTAVLQIHSRKSSIPIDLLNWDFTPMSVPEKDIVMAPQEGVYVRNLYLEGANWDFRKSCLCEPVPLMFVTNLPVIQFKPVQNVTKKKGFYQCPAYYYPQRCGTQGRDAFVVTMNIDSGSEPPDHWIKRATAVLLNLST